MKRFLKVFIYLLLIVGVAYYFYTTSSDFNNFVTSVLQFNNQERSDTNTPSAPNVRKKKARKKIPKTLKPDKFKRLDDYARKTPKHYEKDIKTLAQHLVKPATTDIEKVRLLFAWVAIHIKYDDEAINANNFPDYSTENVLSDKKAVCEGYSDLFNALCEATGLEAKKIIGYAKGYGYSVGDKFTESNHAWNAVKIENTWRLLDVTWASGYGSNINGKLVSTSRFDPYWFDVNPKAFIFTHLPEKSEWQLATNEALTIKEYEALPYLSDEFFKLGFNPDEIFNEAATGKTKEFFEAYPTDFPVKAIKFPYSQNLVRGNEVTFQIESDYAEEMVLIDDRLYHYFKKENNTFNLSYKPIGKHVLICIRINWFDKKFTSIAKYSVKEKPKNNKQNLSMAFTFVKKI